MQIGAGPLEIRQAGAITAARQLDGGSGETVRQRVAGAVRESRIHLMQTAGMTQQDQRRG